MTIWILTTCFVTNLYIILYNVNIVLGFPVSKYTMFTSDNAQLQIQTYRMKWQFRLR